MLQRWQQQDLTLALMTRRSKDPIKINRFQAGDTILTILFFTTMGLMIWGINIYRLTIIETKYLFATIVAGIFIAVVVLSFLVKSSYPTTWTFIIKAAIGGGLFYFAFLFINQRFSDSQLQTKQFAILKKGTLGRGKASNCSQPYIEIDFDETEKELVFYCEDADIMKHSKKVILTYSIGAFGFNVIKNKQLAD